MEWILMDVIIPVAIGLIIGVFIGLIIIRKISLILEVHKRTKLRNHVHFYVARDEDGSLYLYLGKPRRSTVCFISFVHPSHFICCSDKFDSFGLKENDYDSLRWEDEPVEVFLNMEE